MVSLFPIVLFIVWCLGMWIRSQPGRHVKHYQKDEQFKENSEQFVTCTKEECEMLDKMMTPYWLRRKHYVDDPYEPYHVRHGINSPRVDETGKLLRERPKVLLDDLTADQHFFER